MKPRQIYLHLCEAPDLSAAVSRLSCDELAAVAQYLARLAGRGISAQVWGAVRSALEEKGIKA